MTQINTSLTSTSLHNITWAQFEVCNANKQDAFEQLCRWLFNEFFFSGKETLRSNPNNPGIEVAPVFHKDSNSLISFQAKYFDTMNYSQIQESARKAVKYYKGKLDVIYLYCNKDVTDTSLGYKTVIDILEPAGIKLVPITNQAILEQVMQHNAMCWHFFDQVILSKQWFRERLNISQKSLGPRYNTSFNVATHTEALFEHFLCNTDAVCRINHNKTEVISELVNHRFKYSCCNREFQEILLALESLSDVSIENISNCLTWTETINLKCATAFDTIRTLLKRKQDDLAKIDCTENRTEYVTITSDINAILHLLNVPALIAPEDYAQTLMRSQALIIKGKAGSGKSQLLAVASEKIFNAGCAVILLLGTNFINNNLLWTQASEILDSSLTLDAIMHKLEAIAILNNTYSYIMVDAINESTYKDVWKTGFQSLLTKLSHYPHIKMVVSVRNGYEKLVFDDATIAAIDENTLPILEHTGFREESIAATVTFLNHYGIPFLPTYFLQSEMTNPLFLTLFCQTYTGENYDIFSLFRNLIERADREAQAAADISDPMPLLEYLIDEMVAYRLKTNTLTITQTNLFDFAFWNRYGLANKKIQYLKSLEKSGLLIGSVHNDEETYYLGYNLLEDFVCARAIIKLYKSASDLIHYLLNNLLSIEDGKIKNRNNIDIFIIVCGLFAEEHNKECFEDISKHIPNKIDCEDIVDRYLESFMWRTATSVNSDDFLLFLSKHPVNKETLFRVLIENSTKEHHPLNSLFLHSLLFTKTLSARDELWTSYINHLATNDIRIFQLITYFDNGNLMDGLSNTNTKLLLILLAWLLTSSNRLLRDKASKASIELLKHEFNLCMPLLQHFEGINDPYVAQRLYGIVFGACMKREQEHKSDFKGLTKYVYSTIFNQELVYPDILLRDYARLIVERWMHEYPADSDFIETSKIIPPYRSIPIPIVERQEYQNDESVDNFLGIIDYSMRIDHPECPGIYGDFGRYTFQSALSNFEGIDILNLYHYAMQFIRDELGYNEQLSAIDATFMHYNFSRQSTKKAERIGKKYQWITFHNILARISDYHLVKDWDEPSQVYTGPWNPYIRDFDPTLNRNFLHSQDIPSFSKVEKNLDFLPQEPVPTSDEIQGWIQAKPDFYTTIQEKLMLKDIESNEWIVLHLYDNHKSKPLIIDDQSFGTPSGTQEVWLLAKAYFARPNDISFILEHIRSKHYDNDFPDEPNIYQLFNREYAWSPGYKYIFERNWFEYEIESDEYRLEKEIIEKPDYERMSVNADGEISIPIEKVEREIKVPIEIFHVNIMPAFSRVLWEEQYDASQEESTSFNIPCGDIIRHLRLTQKVNDGHYYSEDGTLVCFDSSLNGQNRGLLIRSDYLRKYLDENNLRILWTCIGEKQYFLGFHNQEWSNWKGSFVLEDDTIHGEFERYEREP